MSELLVQVREKSIEAVHEGDIKALYELVENHHNELNDEIEQGLYGNILDLALELLTNTLETQAKLSLNEETGSGVFRPDVSARHPVPGLRHGAFGPSTRPGSFQQLLQGNSGFLPFSGDPLYFVTDLSQPSIPGGPSVGGHLGGQLGKKRLALFFEFVDVFLGLIHALFQRSTPAIEFLTTPGFPLLPGPSFIGSNRNIRCDRLPRLCYLRCVFLLEIIVSPVIAAQPPPIYGENAVGNRPHK